MKPGRRAPVEPRYARVEPALSPLGGRERLVVFARTPHLGRVKTRLSPPLTTHQALDIHRALLEDTLERLARLDRPGLEHWLYLSEPWTPGQLDVAPRFSLALQAGRDLGARLESAFRQGFEDGVKRVVVVGSDSPTLPLEHVEQAYQALTRHDAVVGPAEDGGYYLVGASRFLPELTREMPWGSSRLLGESTRALARANRSFHLLPIWYDVDTADDLQRLERELVRLRAHGHPEWPRRTAGVLSSFFGKGKIPS